MSISDPDYNSDDSDNWQNLPKFGESAWDTTTSDDVDREYCCVIINGKIIPKQSLHEFTQHLAEKNNALIEGVQKHIEQLLNACGFPQSWIEENINKPNHVCKEEVLRISTLIFEKYKLMPVRVAPSVEEGILLTYWQEEKNKTLKIEIYNDLEMVGLINKDKDIVTSKNILHDQDIFTLVDNFC